MNLRLTSLTLVFVALILFSRSANAASFCVTDDFFPAAHRAEVIFSGKIMSVEPVQSKTAATGEYLVTFRVETWWKGNSSHEMRVLWRSSVLDCPFLPVGEVGEDYLVYADPKRGDNFLEVTLFNRTSRLPANLKPESFVLNDRAQPIRISPRPTLNRADASDDIKLLRALGGCSCIWNSQSPPLLDSWQLPSGEADSRDAERVSTCKSCMRVRLKAF